MRIRIIGPALALPAGQIAPERLFDLIGCTLEADGEAVAAFRRPSIPRNHPEREVVILPSYPDTHEVAIGDVLEALALKRDLHSDALLAWGALIKSGLVYFPFSSVAFDTT